MQTNERREPSGPRDVVVVVPQRLWGLWLAEGDLPGDPPAESGLWDFACGAVPQETGRGARVYVAAWGFLRGYAPLLRVEAGSLVRGGDAVACTLTSGMRPMKIGGWRGARYRWFDRADAQPFPEGPDGAATWATYGLPQKLRAEVLALFAERAKGPVERALLRALALGGVAA